MQHIYIIYYMNWIENYVDFYDLQDYVLLEKKPFTRAPAFQLTGHSVVSHIRSFGTFVCFIQQFMFSRDHKENRDRLSEYDPNNWTDSKIRHAMGYHTKYINDQVIYWLTFYVYKAIAQGMSIYYNETKQYMIICIYANNMLHST